MFGLGQRNAYIMSVFLRTKTIISLKTKQEQKLLSSSPHAELAYYIPIFVSSFFNDHQQEESVAVTPLLPPI